MEAPTFFEMWALGISEMQALGLHWVIGVVWFVLGSLILLYPIARILRRLGISGWWALLTYVPLVNLIALWTLAFADWPRDRKA